MVSAFGKSPPSFSSRSPFTWQPWLGEFPCCRLKLQRSRGVRNASYIFVAAAVFELAYMLYQAALGEASHFNLSTPFNAHMYKLMGLGAVTLTVVTAYLGWRIRKAGTTPMHFAAGWSFIVSAVATTLVAGYLAQGQGHWIGGDQTDATGLPFFHWSTTGGDLRVAHFAALHLMQAVPLIAWFWPDKRIGQPRSRWRGHCRRPVRPGAHGPAFVADLSFPPRSAIVAETIREHLNMAKASKTDDLFGNLPTATKPSAKATAKTRGEEQYTAADIEVLEGLEPVRRRPGMYIGGTDEKALHHLFSEVMDNAMDEAVAGHATWIDVEYDAEGYLAVTDNGRGIPIDPHPKFKNKSALEVIMTTLHAGGKFDSKVYETSGGLHGVGVSVVNALSEHCIVEVARGQQLYKQEYARGIPPGKIQSLGKITAAAAPPSASSPTGRFSARATSRFPPQGFTACPAPNPISSAAWKSAGSAIPPTSRTRKPRKRPCCISPAA